MCIRDSPESACTGNTGYQKGSGIAYMDINNDMKRPVGNIRAHATLIMIYLFAVVLMGNLCAVIDVISGSNSGYFTEAHLVMGIFSALFTACLLYTSPSPRDRTRS